jgi:hypothetical protein
MKTCKTCAHFNRGRWHKDVDPEEADQVGGNCKLLLELIAMNNSTFLKQERLYVPESFGCVLHRGIQK